MNWKDVAGQADRLVAQVEQVLQLADVSIRPTLLGLLDDAREIRDKVRARADATEGAQPTE